MINKTDLRIGNSVMNKGIAWEVEELKEDNVTLFNSVFGWKVLDYSDIHPIPITEEVLCKMGFNPTPSCYEFAKTLNYTHQLAHIDMSDQIITIRDVASFNFDKIEFVHQLQNIIYSLTQTELTYEP